ncbi:hypothetical protein P3342_005359 [Pyrenophora teres f. teres]|nr:hypothetical protein P3342_005359 [Pyrenophora teres f. teres]
MSTTYLSIHDLLRITYTYEMQAAEAEANMQLPQARLRSDSACSMPEICAHLDPLHHTLTWRPRHRRRMMASSRLISPRCTVARDDAHEEVALSAPVSPLKSGVLGPLFREACFVPLHRRLCKYDAICLWRPKTDRMR